MAELLRSPSMGLRRRQRCCWPFRSGASDHLWKVTFPPYGSVISPLPRGRYCIVDCRVGGQVILLWLGGLFTSVYILLTTCCLLLTARCLLFVLLSCGWLPYGEHLPVGSGHVSRCVAEQLPLGGSGASATRRA